MRYLIITATQCPNKTWLYEEIGPAGRKRLVPTYWAEMGDKRIGMKYHFAVTRDSASVVFRHQRERYELTGECPPNKPCKPYLVRLCELPRNGDSLLLWEPGFANNHTIRGVGNVDRSTIAIHRAPATSLGCMGIAGGARAYRQWLAQARTLLPTQDIHLNVCIEPRPESHHTRHLSR